MLAGHAAKISSPWMEIGPFCTRVTVVDVFSLRGLVIESGLDGLV